MDSGARPMVVFVLVTNIKIETVFGLWSKVKPMSRFLKLSHQFTADFTSPVRQNGYATINP